MNGFSDLTVQSGVQSVIVPIGINQEEKKKICSCCKIEKNLSEFGKSKFRKDGLHVYCKSCCKEKRTKNKEYMKDYLKEYYNKNIIELKIKQKKYNDKNKDKRIKYLENKKEDFIEYRKKYFSQQSVIDRRREYYNNNNDKIKTKRKEWNIKNKELKSNLGKIYAKNNFKKIKTYKQQYYKTIAKYSIFAEKLLYAEKLLCSENDETIAFCAYCGKDFLLTVSQVNIRIGSLNNGGEGRLYCCNECKKACPTYGQQLYFKKPKKASSREVLPEFRQLALKHFNYTCQKCGSQEGGLHIHHIEGVVQIPLFQADICNTLAVCKECHKKIHQIPGCKMSDYKCKET